MKTDNGKKRTVGNPILVETLVIKDPQVGQGGEPTPVLAHEQRADFLAWLFSDEEVARRPKDRELGKRVGLLGMHVSKQHCHYLHGSDMVERIYVAVRELERGGITNRRACAKVAKLLSGVLGQSGRGRPSAHPKGSEFSRKIETVRSIVNRFSKKQHPWKSLLPCRDVVVENYVGRFLWLRKARIVVGSKYASDAGRRSVQDWMQRVGLSPVPDEPKQSR